MISHLRGVIRKPHLGEVTVDISGVGYRVMVPSNVWDALEEGSAAEIAISTYVREDRFDLYGFLDSLTRSLFDSLIDISGIGPRTALELCGVPTSLLVRAIHGNDPSVLTSVKGIGKKTAEKILVELKSLAENHPEMFLSDGADNVAARYDQDTIAALAQLGFATQDILRVLEGLPKNLTSPEERVAAALRSL